MSYFNTKMKGIENLFADATSFSNKNLNERRNFDLNIYSDNFKLKFEYCNKKYMW